MKRSSLLAAVVLLSPLAIGLRHAAAAPQDAKSVQRAEELALENSSQSEVRYLLYLPETARKGEKTPLLVFLHGAGERGDNIERVKIHGPPKIVETGKSLPFIIVSPQCPKRARWQPEVVGQLIDHIVATHPVDEDRIYLTGLSMGGYGTWATGSRYPERFAAIAPICGGGDPTKAWRLKGMPIWNFHGAKDRVVSIERSRRMARALEKVECDFNFTIYENANHDSWTETYANPKLYAWFLEHRRSDRGARVNEITGAKPEAVGISSEKLAAIDPAVETFVKDGKIAGAIAMVARKGKVVHAKAYGKRVIDGDKPMQLDTIFRFYSMTKPVTSVAAMILVEEGKLELDAPVAKYLPQLAGVRVYVSGEGDDVKTEKPRRAMTIRDLHRHTAGLTYGLFGNTPVDRMYHFAGVLRGTSAEMVDRLAKIPLVYHPGEHWVYSVGEDVLGRVIEVVSKKTLDEFFAERIFAPLDMKDTGFSVPGDKMGRFAASYGPNGGGGLRVVEGVGLMTPYRRPPQMFSGGAGLVSTARDYLRFAQMVLNGGELDGVRILKSATVEAMTKNQLPESAMPIGIGPAKRTGVGFGLGFAVRVAESGLEPAGRVGELGWGGVASTHFWISPRDDLIVIALSQYQPYSDRLERALKPIVYDALKD